MFPLQVSQNGLDIVGYLIDRLASEFKPYLNTVLTSVLDRLGDTRLEVREKANIVLCKLMDATVTPQQLFEKISPGFSHKNSRVREEVLLLLQNTLNAHGASALTVSKLIPAIVTSTSDPQAAVRDAAINTLVEIYRSVIVAMIAGVSDSRHACNELVILRAFLVTTHTPDIFDYSC